MKQSVVTFCILLIFVANNFLFSNVIGADSLLQAQPNINKDFTSAEHIKTLTEIGNTLKPNSPDSAIYYYNLALEIAIRNSDDKNEAELLSRIGGAKYILGEFDSALDYFIQSLNIFRNSKDKKGIAVGLNNVGIIYNIIGKSEEARSNHLNSALLCEEIGDSDLLAKNYFNLGILNQTLHNYDTALYFANKHFQINTQLNNENEILKVSNLKGYIYLEQGKYLLAKDEFLTVINKESYKNSWEISYALSGLSTTEQKLGDLDQSIYYGKKSLNLAIEIQAKWDIQNVSEILSESYALKGDFENAYYYHIEHKLYSDSIFNDERENRVNYLQLKQEDFEYIMLAKENEVKTERIQKKNDQMMLIAFGTILFILIAVFLFRTTRLKTKLNNELINKNAEIDIKNKELIQLNATKDAFFRIIGHDVKTPISTVVSFTDLLQNNYEQFSKEEILEYLGVTKESAHNAIDLLENLLEWAKAQTGITNVKPLESNVLRLINDSVKHLNSNISSKNITLNIDVPDDLTSTLDRNMTVSILRNLLSNAIKFTNENGKITMSAEKDNKGVLIVISDNGVGMSSEKLESLFQIENASSSTGTRNEKGTGVGLILCKDFTEKQGGEIWAESEPGKGSTFYLRL